MKSQFKIFAGDNRFTSNTGSFNELQYEIKSFVSMRCAPYSARKNSQGLKLNRHDIARQVHFQKVVIFTAQLPYRNILRLAAIMATTLISESIFSARIYTSHDTSIFGFVFGVQLPREREKVQLSARSCKSEKIEPSQSGSTRMSRLRLVVT